MSIYNKTTQNVADVVSKIMAEKLHPNQQKLDVHEPEKDKLTADDFKKLRSMKKEEAEGASKKKEEKFHMGLDKLVHKTFGHSPAEKKEKMKKEEVELTESHFKVGDEVVCKASGMEGEVIEVDPKGEGKYYTVKREDGKTMKYAPDELKLEDEDEDEDDKLDEEQLDELSVNKMLNYRAAATKQLVTGPAEKEQKRKAGIGMSGTKIKAALKKEDVEEIEESWNMGQVTIHSPGHRLHGKKADIFHKHEDGKVNVQIRHSDKKGDLTNLTLKPNQFKMNEETEQLQEYQSKEGVYKHQGTYGRAKGAEFGGTDWDKEEANKKEKPKKAKYGARQNYVRSPRVNETFSEMLSMYQEKGLKSLSEMAKVKEEVDSEDFEKEMKDQKDKFDGKKKGADVAKASVQAVKNESVHTEIQVIDMTNADQPIKISKIDLEERELSDAEKQKKEKYVMSMKKSLSGFKDRYGDRAKEVLYATATKMAKKED